MKILKIFLVLISLCIYLNADDKYHEEHNKHHVYKNLEYLNLSIAQSKKIKEVLIEYKKEYTHYYEKKEKKEKRLQKLFRKKDFDAEEYKDISKDIHKKAIKLEAKTLKKIHNILNKKQRKRFSYYLKEWQVE